MDYHDMRKQIFSDWIAEIELNEARSERRRNKIRTAFWWIALACATTLLWVGWAAR